MAVSRGLHFFQNPGPTNIPDRVLRAMDHGHDRFYRGAIQSHRRGMLCRPETDLQDRTDDPRLCRFGARRLGGRARQPVFAGRQGAGGRKRLFLIELGHALRSRSGSRSRRWPMTGAAPPTPPRSKPDCARTASIRSRRCWSSTTRPRPGSSTMSRRCAGRSTPPRHPALFLVDVISSLASMDFRMDEWGVDVVVAGSQKGLMLPTGMAFTGVSAKALAAAARGETAAGLLGLAAAGRRRQLAGGVERHRRRCISSTGCRRRCACSTRKGSTTSSPAITGSPRRRGARCASGGRTTGPRSLRVDPRAQSDSVTAVLPPRATTPTRCAQACLDRFNVSLGGGLGPLAGPGLPHRPSGRSERADDPGRARRGRNGARSRRRAARQGRHRCGDELPYLRGMTPDAAATSRSSPGERFF